MKKYIITLALLTFCNVNAFAESASAYVDFLNNVEVAKFIDKMAEKKLRLSQIVSVEADTGTTIKGDFGSFVLVFKKVAYDDDLPAKIETVSKYQVDVGMFGKLSITYIPM